MEMGRKNALLSVYNKEGIVEFAEGLVRLGWNILSSGGTAKVLSEAGVEVTDVAEITGRPAVLNHRVVTLAPEIHGGLLATDDTLEELAGLGWPYIDLVCVDLYPLQDEIDSPDATPESIIEKTDIGGPTLLRSGAKGRRIVICAPEDREIVLDWLGNGCPNDKDFRNDLAAKAELTVAKYCLASAHATSGEHYEMVGGLVATCKYGENAYQAPACLYSVGSKDSLALDKFEVVEGTPPSYNNWCDIERLLQTATHIAAGRWTSNGYQEKAIAVGVKHGNPCGAATDFTMGVALSRMMAGDPLAIFGGLILVNFRITEELAGLLAGKMLDGIVAPSFTDDAINLLRRKGDKCRFIANPALYNLAKNIDTNQRFRYVRGGFLVQPNYTFIPNFDDAQITKYGDPSMSQIDDMIMAWAVGSTSNSNTITLVKDRMLIGNGVGQQDRVGAANLAVTRAMRSGHDIEGAVAYSDSFFPFPDGPEVLIKAGVKAIFTSSGSINDQLTIDLCKQNDVILCMVPDGVGRGFFGH